ncbi:adenylosuccinate lyase [Isachenkonia alkalipeptolytica]|uniref:Adenylosuccinate lyase n=1 Tax=Isachenkonia alkalipeptolytica TaxID=2565777 RepID=A0AA44BFR4_9CLOT|nr:adenylosuccinate lyase [Isachenkonia alkalipeptolytica]
MLEYNIYQNPLIERYTSEEMLYTFSPDNKFKNWRKLWVALAETEKELGLKISDEQINELKAHQKDINYEVAKKREQETRHDVMSHVYAYGIQCPKAKPIIHLGATSAFVGDNTDIIVYREALQLIQKKLINLMDKLGAFAKAYKDLPTLGYTHYQPAQITTVGKRASLWLYELYMDYEKLTFILNQMKFRGVKGTTGTQASFLALFDNDSEKVKTLDRKLSKRLGFEENFPLTGQTYSRKQDFDLLYVLSSIAQSMHKMTNDIRLLQHLKEIEEPFEKNQIGSSAMAYKRNPMRSERISSLSKFVMSALQNLSFVSATQWFERTLDDSANRRITIPETFMATDAILDIGINIASGLVVNDKVIEENLKKELPFMATENIMMEAVKKGKDRQELHERIRQHSLTAGHNVKKLGMENNLLQLIAEDSYFGLTKEELLQIVDPYKYTGRSGEQVEDFINDNLVPILQKHQEMLGAEVHLKV